MESACENVKPMVALDRALSIMTRLGAAGPLGVSELARQLDLPKAAVYRILRTLNGRGFVHFDPATESYSLGISLLELAEKVRSQVNISELAYPHLAALANATGETASLAVLRGMSALVVRTARPERGALLTADLGPTAPLHCSGIGKVLLAHSPAGLIKVYVKDGSLIRYTPNTITERAALRAELAAIVKQGWAVDNEELEEGLYCIAAPVFGPGGQVLAAVSISGPTSRLTANQGQLLAELKRAATAISRRLGWQRAGLK